MGNQHAGLEPSGTPAWKTSPSWYPLGTQDKIITPAAQLSIGRDSDHARDPEDLSARALPHRPGRQLARVHNLPPGVMDRACNRLRKLLVSTASWSGHGPAYRPARNLGPDESPLPYVAFDGTRAAGLRWTALSASTAGLLPERENLLARPRGTCRSSLSGSTLMVSNEGCIGAPARRAT